ALPALRYRLVGLVVALAGAYWGTVSCNKTAIDAREPTLAAMDGSDMFGYAITADWLRAHPASRPPRTDAPVAVMPYANLYRHRGGPVHPGAGGGGGGARPRVRVRAGPGVRGRRAGSGDRLLPRRARPDVPAQPVARVDRPAKRGRRPRRGR